MTYLIKVISTKESTIVVIKMYWILNMCHGFFQYFIYHLIKFLPKPSQVTIFILLILQMRKLRSIECITSHCQWTPAIWRARILTQMCLLPKAMHFPLCYTLSLIDFSVLLTTHFQCLEIPFPLFGLKGIVWIDKKQTQVVLEVEGNNRIHRCRTVHIWGQKCHGNQPEWEPETGKPRLSLLLNSSSLVYKLLLSHALQTNFLCMLVHLVVSRPVYYAWVTAMKR